MTDPEGRSPITRIPQLIRTKFVRFTTTETWRPLFTASADDPLASTTRLIATLVDPAKVDLSMTAVTETGPAAVDEMADRIIELMLIVTFVSLSPFPNGGDGRMKEMPLKEYELHDMLMFAGRVVTLPLDGLHGIIADPSATAKSSKTRERSSIQ